MKKPAVVIIDDHAVLRRGLKDLFRHSNIDVVAEGSNVNEALELATNHASAIFIVDLNLGGEENGFPLIAKLRGLDIRVMIYSMRDNLDTILAAYRAGASAYIPKSADSSALVDAVNKIAEGGTYFMPGSAEQLMLYISTGASDNPTDLLNASELKIFILAANGKRAEEIAKELDFAVGTVHNRLSGIRRKLNCSNMDFYKIALKHGLVA